MNVLCVVSMLLYACLCTFSRTCSIIRCGAAKLPSFSFETPLKPVEAFDLLLNLAPGDPNVCSSKPVGVAKPATFIVANEAVGKIDDLRADNLGVWEHKGKPIRQYKVSRLSSGEVYGAELSKDSGNNIYQLVRVYYHHKHTPTFRRTLFYLAGMQYLSLLQLFKHVYELLCRSSKNTANHRLVYVFRWKSGSH